MKIQKSLLLTLALGATSALSAQVTLLNDDFTSGTTGPLLTSGNVGKGIQSPGSSAIWFANGSTAKSDTTGTTLGAAPIQYVSGTGIETNGTTTQSITSFFEAPGSYATLGSGDSLTLTVDFNVSSAADAAGGLKFALINSGSTGSSATTATQTGTNNQLVLTSGNTSGAAANPIALGNYTGYYAEFNAGAATTAQSADSLFHRPSGHSTFVTSNTGFVSLGAANPGNNTALTSDKYQGVLTISNTGTSNTISYSITDITGTPTVLSQYTISQSDSTPIDSFDGIILGGLGGDGAMTYDSVAVNAAGPDFAAIPEPSVYAAVLGAATLGFVLVRSRRQRHQEIA